MAYIRRKTGSGPGGKGQGDSRAENSTGGGRGAAGARGRYSEKRGFKSGGPGGKPKSAAKPIKPLAKKSVQRSVQSREGGVRLNKYLADHGVASRRAADELIAEGRVSVDGVQVKELGLRVDPATQLIELNGEALEVTKVEHKRYYLLNKPAGVVCTNERRETRPRAIDLITDRAKGRIYTVGRLDEESKGLLILTNDGEFANRVMHPRYGIAKTYEVKLRGRIEDSDLQRVREGVYLAEGRSGQVRILIKKRTHVYSLLEVTLHEGKNREIRRIFHSVGFKVVELRRIQIGPIFDRKLKVGYWRFLEQDEVDRLLAETMHDEDGSPMHGRTKNSARSAARKANRRNTDRPSQR